MIKKRTLAVFALMVVTSSCNSQNIRPEALLTQAPKPAAAADPTPQTLLQAIKPVSFKEAKIVRPSLNSGDFYVSLSSRSFWTPNSRECVDEGVVSFFRKIFRKESATASVMVSIQQADASPGPQMPLFMVGKNEAAAQDKPKCYSETTNSALIPWTKVDASSKFKVSFGVAVSKDSDFSGAEKVFTALQDVLAFAGSSGTLVKKLSGGQIEQFGSRLDSAVSEHFSNHALDKGSFDVLPLPAQGDGNDDIAAIDFALPNIKAEARGVSFGTQNLPSLRLALMFRQSLFAGAGGAYPDVAQIITQSLGANKLGHSLASLDRLVDSGISGVNKETLSTTSAAPEAARQCNQIKLALAPAFTSKDALVARYSIVRVFMRQYNTNDALRSTECFDAGELGELSGMRFAFDDSVRLNKERREAKIAERMKPLVSAIRSKNEEALRKLLPADLKAFSMTQLSVKLPEFSKDQPAWSGAGEDGYKRLVGLASARIGCFQASPSLTLNQISTVMLVGQVTVSGVFFFNADGLLESVYLGSIEEGRRIGSLSGDWPEKSEPACPLI